MIGSELSETDSTLFADETSSKGQKRKAEGTIDVYDSYSMVAEDCKRQKIDEWARKVRGGQL